MLPELEIIRVELSAVRNKLSELEKQISRMSEFQLLTFYGDRHLIANSLSEIGKEAFNIGEIERRIVTKLPEGSGDKG